MNTATRIIDFDSAHRVLKHESKCRHVHGHRYSAHITIRSPKLDELGRVIDFGTIKEICKTWIDAKLDHNIILNSQDPLAKLYREHEGEYIELMGDRAPFIIENKNPTVEVIAQDVLMPNLRRLILGYNVSLEVSEITLYETANCYTVARNPLL